MYLNQKIVGGTENVLTLKLYYDLNKAEYTVEYYLQDKPGSAKYTLDTTESKSAKLGANVTAKIKVYKGYFYNSLKSDITGVVNTEGLVLKVY